MYRPYCKDIKEFSGLREQPIPAYTIDDQYQHIRQRAVNAKRYEWTLDLKHCVNSVERKSLCVAILNINTAKMVKTDHKDGIQLDSKRELLSLIENTTNAKNVSYHVIVSCKVDLANLTFPSQKGVNCLIVIRASEIINRTATSSKKIGNKIKMKLMFDDEDWRKQQDMPDKIQSLLMDLSQELVVRKKIYIYGNHGGAWYYSRLKPKKYYSVKDGDEERTVYIKTNYVEYDHKKRPIPRLRESQILQQTHHMDLESDNKGEEKKDGDEEMEIDNERKDEEENDGYENDVILRFEEDEEMKEDMEDSSQVDISADSYHNVFEQQFEDEISNEIHEFMEQSADEIRKTGKFEDKRKKANVNRGKYWAGSGNYWYKGDKEELGDILYKRCMKVAKGVRLFNKSIPDCFMKLQKELIKMKVVEEEADCVACNIYTPGPSSIENHNEADRYRVVLHVTFSSKDPKIVTYLSINQFELHGTAEVNLRSEHGEIVKFGSLVFLLHFICFI